MSGNGVLWGVAAVALGGCIAGAIASPAAMLASWLAALDFWLGAAIACTGWRLIHRLTGGAWGAALTVPLQRGAAALPWLCLMLLPVLLGLDLLYPWSADASRRTVYLAPGFFIGRTLIYVAIWIVLWLLERRLGDSAWTVAIAAGGLLLLVLSITFASIDWTMSLEPDWASSAYGMIAIVSHVQAGLALALLLAGPQPATLNGDLNKLQLAVLLVWGYLAFMQFLIIWSENLSHEIPWYLERMSGGWGMLGESIAATHLAVPFLLLLPAGLKRRRTTLIGCALLLGLSELAHEFWLVLPAFDRLPVWAPPSAAILIGLFWLTGARHAAAAAPAGFAAAATGAADG